jgi:uncharacterized protein (TIGR00251 family)
MGDLACRHLTRAVGRSTILAMEIPSYLRDAPEGCRIAVRVHPRARRNGIAGEHAGALKVEVTAPPEGGAANKAVEELIAAALGVARRAVTVAVGHGSRSKTLSVTGVDAATVATRLVG